MRSALLPALAAVLIAAVMASLCLGRYTLPPSEVLDYLLSPLTGGPADPARARLLHALIIEIRLPRVLAALLVGSALAVSGTSFQAVFRNPLVSPAVLGVLAGAAAGAALGMLASSHWWVMQIAAFAGGVTAVAMGVGVAAIFGGSLIMLVLGGIISGALFTAVLSLVKYAADPYDQLPAIVYWLMGSLGNTRLDDLAHLGPPMLFGILTLCLLGRAMDLLSMGDDEAAALGIPVRPLRYGIIAAATLCSALTVAMAGIIGWIGLLVPHCTRMLTGPANTIAVPASALLGALFLLLADGLSRNITTTEIPIGILTELIGVPAFLLVLVRARRSWVVG